MSKLNTYGINQYSMKEIRQITEKEFLNAVEPNVLNLFCYIRKHSKEMNPEYADTVLAYFNDDTKEVKDIAEIYFTNLAEMKNVRNTITGLMTGTNTYKYLKTLQSVIFDGIFFIMACTNEAGVLINLRFTLSKFPKIEIL